MPETTDLAPLPAAPPDVPRRLSPWEQWDAKLKFAGALVSTGFCPVAIRTPAQALAVILAGQELGIPAMQSLRVINVIQGKVTLAAELMLALMHRAGIVFTWNEEAPDRCTLTATRPNGSTYTGVYTVEEAKLAGLLSKDGWKKYPRAMLRARVISLVGRVIAPDVLLGVYTPEEMGFDVDADGSPTAAPATPDTPAVPIPDAMTGSPFVAASWVALFDQTPEAGGAVRPIVDPETLNGWWATLTTGFRATWDQFVSDDQKAIADAYRKARARFADGE